MTNDRPDFISMSWADRVRVLSAQARNATRAGATAVLTGLGLSEGPGPVDGFGFDYLMAASFFVGGCLVWALTTLAAPPKV